MALYQRNQKLAEAPNSSLKESLPYPQIWACFEVPFFEAGDDIMVSGRNYFVFESNHERLCEVGCCYQRRRRVNPSMKLP